jgi:hypothetical protein
VEPADLASELIVTFLEPFDGLGEQVYYSTGLASFTAFSAAAGLPHSNDLWLVARAMLDSAGGLFGLYLAVMIGLLLIGRAMRFRRRVTARMPRPSA